MKAMRTGDVSAVTPFRYTRLLFGAGPGIIMFDETLTLGMLVGSGLIVLSGLFILWRGQKKVAVGDPAAQASESTDLSSATLPRNAPRLRRSSVSASRRCGLGVPCPVSVSAPPLAAG